MRWMPSRFWADLHDPMVEATHHRAGRLLPFVEVEDAPLSQQRSADRVPHKTSLCAINCIVPPIYYVHFLNIFIRQGRRTIRTSRACFGMNSASSGKMSMRPAIVPSRFTRQSPFYPDDASFLRPAARCHRQRRPAGRSYLPTF